MLVEDMSRNKCFYEISYVLRFISICDLFTDSPSYSYGHGIQLISTPEIHLIIKTKKVVSFLFYSVPGK
jgi:hypothetical protein